jgi:hypothetical protein
LLAEGRVREVRDIVNGGATGTNLIFPGVDGKERFTILVLGPRRASDDTFRASTMAFSLGEAADPERLRLWTPATTVAFAPHTRTLPSVRHGWETDLAIALQERHPPLDFDTNLNPEATNPWQLRYTQLFNSSTGQKDFHRREDLEAGGFTLQVNREMLHPDGRRLVPVFEGQMINRWDHRAKTYEGYVGPNRYGRAPGIPWVTEVQHADRSSTRTHHSRSSLATGWMTRLPRIGSTQP